MTRAERRHRRERVITRRLNIIVNAWGYRGQEKQESFAWAFEKPGRFAKWNLKCTCSMCKRDRYKRERFDTFGTLDDVPNRA